METEEDLNQASRETLLEFIAELRQRVEIPAVRRRRARSQDAGA